MPFITEEVWQNLKERKKGESIMVSVISENKPYDETILRAFEYVKEVIVGIRNIRKQNNIAFKDALSLHVKKSDRYPVTFESVIQKMGNMETVETVNDAPQGSWSFIVDTVEYFIPAAGQVDTTELKTKLEAELLYTQGFLKSVTAKLSNERFVNGAPEQVVANERKKQADAEVKIKAIETQLAQLK